MLVFFFWENLSVSEVGFLVGVFVGVNFIMGLVVKIEVEMNRVFVRVMEVWIIVRFLVCYKVWKVGLGEGKLGGC